MAKKYSVNLVVETKNMIIKNHIASIFSEIFSSAFYLEKYAVLITLSEKSESGYPFVLELVELKKKTTLSHYKKKGICPVSNGKISFKRLIEILCKSLNKLDEDIESIHGLKTPGDDMEFHIVSYDKNRTSKKNLKYISNIESAIIDIIFEYGGRIEEGEKIKPKKEGIPLSKDFIMTLYYNINEGSLQLFFVGNKAFLVDNYYKERASKFFYLDFSRDSSCSAMELLQTLEETSYY